MSRARVVVCLVAVVWLSLSVPVLATRHVAQKSSITFINRTGTSALVKLVGPSRHTIEVGDGGSRAVRASGGRYQLLVRYGSDPKKYRYTKGEPFDVHESATEYEEITITLHTVAGGNYDSQPSSPEEFNRN